MSMAVKYAMNKKRKMAGGGEVGPPAWDADIKADGSRRAEDAVKRKTEGDDYSVADPVNMASKSRRSGMVDRIMASRGGRIANDTTPHADSEENEFDDLVLDDYLESSYTGANSGDEIGDEQEDKDRKDIVSRVMRSRSKKNR